MHLLLIILSINACKTTNGVKKISTFNGDKTMKVPVLKINKKEYTKIKDLHFKHSVGGEPVEEETLVMMKYSDKYLEVKFECRDNPRIEQNYFTKDNTKMYTQEVFEIFISNGELSNEKYIEIQINPNNALFLSKIKNTYKTDKKFSSDFIDTTTSDVSHYVEKKIEENIWKGYLRIPMEMLKYPNAISKDTYRINLYRIISNADHANKNWMNNSDNSTFACWSSTFSKNPQFHSPDHFGFLILE